MSIDLASGDTILLNGTAAEVIKTYSVGDLDYLRAYVENAGVKTVCIDDVDIEQKGDQLGDLEPSILTTRRSQPSGSTCVPKPSSFRLPTSKANC